MPVTTDSLVTLAFRRAGISSPTTTEVTRAKTEYLEDVLKFLFLSGRPDWKTLRAVHTSTLASGSTSFVAPSDWLSTRLLQCDVGTAPSSVWIDIVPKSTEEFHKLYDTGPTVTTYPQIYVDELGGGTLSLWPTADQNYPLRLYYLVNISATSDATHPTLRTNIYQQFGHILVDGIWAYILEENDDDRAKVARERFDLTARANARIVDGIMTKRLNTAFHY